MKKLMLFIGIAGFVCVVGASGAVATTMTYDYSVTLNQSIDTSGTTPSSTSWTTLNFPDGTGTYNPGTFEYDNYSPNNVQAFTISMSGTNDSTDTSHSIEVYLRFGGASGTAKQIASFNPADGSIPFTFTADILNGTASWTQSSATHSVALSNVTLNSFVGYDSFELAPACHFTETGVGVHVGVNTVPEPMSLLFLGMGLLGAVTFRRRFKK